MQGLTRSKTILGSRHFNAQADGVRTYHEEDGKLHSILHIDAQYAVDRAKDIRETSQNGTVGKLLGVVPLTLYYEWMNEATMRGVWRQGEDMKLLNDFIAKKLKDDTYAKLRGL
jgi:hypothetical protein